MLPTIPPFCAACTTSGLVSCKHMSKSHHYRKWQYNIHRGPEEAPLLDFITLPPPYSQMARHASFSIAEWDVSFPEHPVFGQVIKASVLMVLKAEPTLEVARLRHRHYCRCWQVHCLPVLPAKQNCCNAGGFQMQSFDFLHPRMCDSTQMHTSHRAELRKRDTSFNTRFKQPRWICGGQVDAAAVWVNGSSWHLQGSRLTYPSRSCHCTGHMTSRLPDFPGGNYCFQLPC